MDKLEVFLFTEIDKEAARTMLNCRYDKPEVSGWARANTNDIDLVLDNDENQWDWNLDVHFRCVYFDQDGTKKPGWSWKKYLQTLDYALNHGLRIRAHLEDITRADLDGFVYLLVSKILERDATR